MAQETAAPALIGAGNKADEVGNEALERLFEAFIACRTTLDDLSDRAATLGADLSAPVIAAHLTGKSCISAQKHDVLVTAVNARLAELSLPASARHTFSAPRSG
jgi:sugar diacid utilization regulator